jgi:hypothetical protein
VSQTNEARPVPAPLAVPGDDLKVLMDKVRFIYPTAVKGKTAEVDPQLVEVRDYANYVIDYWTKQLDTANLQIMQQMGDAEVATVRGLPIFKRLQYPVKEHIVKAGIRDYLRRTGK